MRELDALFAALAVSRFRSGFRLQGKELAYLEAHGLPAVLAHAAQFIAARLAPAHILNDGKQTPYRGHPAFVAQHATACCCRGCLEKWHRIPPGRDLSPEEQAYLLGVLARWLEAQQASPSHPPAQRGGSGVLFD